MKNVGRIFSIIGGVLAILSGVSLLVSGIIMLLLNVPEIKDSFLNIMQEAASHTSFPVMKVAEYILAGATVSAIINFIAALFAVLAGIFSFNCHKNKSYIITIVFAALAYFQIFVILGSIFGLIFDNKKE